MKANKFDAEYMRCQRSCSMAMSRTVAEETAAEVPRPTMTFERSMIACHANPEVVEEARRQHLLRNLWKKLTWPIDALFQAIDEGARTHRSVLDPGSAIRDRGSNSGG